MERKIERPDGLTFLAIVFVLGAISNIQLGLSWISLTPDDFSVMFSEAPLVEMLLNVWWLEAKLALPMGVVNLILAYSLVYGAGWAWHFWLISSVLGVILSLVNLPIGLPNWYVGLQYTFSIIVGIFSIYYRTRPDVKTFFGKT